MKARNSLYNVMTKRVMFNLKVLPSVRAEFKIAATLRGATASGLLHQYMVQVIREEKTRHPEAFVDIAAAVSTEAELPDQNIAQPGTSETEKIEGVIDAVQAYAGRPISEEAWIQIRKILEENTIPPTQHSPASEEPRPSIPVHRMKEVSPKKGGRY